jgi:hypothetical protein
MNKTLSAALVAALALTPIIASAAITPGTVLVGNMDESLSAPGAQVGQSFTISNVHSQDRNINGATIYGHVASVTGPSQGRNAQIELAFDKLHTRSGNSYAITGSATQVQTNTKSNALKEAGGAVAGAIVGSIIGRSLLHTNLGAPVGAAGGYVAAKNNRAGITIPQNAVVSVQIESARPQARR